MKLPDINPKINWGMLTEFELAQLHCLRSIAVNLEVIARFMGHHPEINAEIYKTWTTYSQKTSVRE